MTAALPAWVAEYQRLVYGERDGAGKLAPGAVDCWELVRRVLRDRAGCDLPDWGAAVSDGDMDMARRVMADRRDDWRWVEVEGPPDVYDVAMMMGYYRRGGRLHKAEIHVGVVVAPGWLMHVEQGLTHPVCVRLDDQRVARRIVSFWRAAGGAASSMPAPVSGQVQVVARPHPMRLDRAVKVYRAGVSVADIVADIQPDEGLRDFCTARIAGEPIPRELWRLVRPKPGTQVTISAVMPRGGGGGKQALAIVMTLAVIAAAIAVPALAPATMGTALIGGLTVGNVVTGAIIAVGGLAVSALTAMPPPKADRLSGLEMSSPTLSIAGARNAFRPWGPIPVVLGRHRQTPSLGALTYTESVGDRQYLRMLLVAGYGPMVEEEPRIGSTPLGEFSGVETEFRRGYQPAQIRDRGSWSPASGWPSSAEFGDRWTASSAGSVSGINFVVGDTITYNGLWPAADKRAWDLNEDKPLRLFPADVDEEQLSIRMTQAWSVRTTGADADEIAVEFTFPSGLFELDSKGNKNPTTCTVSVQYSVAGANAWTALPVPVPSARRAQTSAVRMGASWKVTRGRYDVRCARLGAESTSTNRVDAVYWTALRTIRSAPAADITGLCVRTLRIRATDQLSGTIDNYSAIYTSIAREWDGAAWVMRPTRQPAALFRLVCQGPGNAQPRPDSAMDLPRLQEWAEYTTARGWTCDHVVDYRSSVWEMLMMIAAVGRAWPAYRGGRMSVIIDRPQAAPVQTFTARNSREWSADYTYPVLPHAYRCRYMSSETWQWDERIAYVPGYDEATATVYEERQMMGVTSAAQAWELAQLELATALRRALKTWSFTADIEAIVCEPGDRIEVQHDIVAAGMVAARLAEVWRNVTGAVSALRLDVPMRVDAGIGYAASVRDARNVRHVISVTAAPGSDVDTFTVSPAYADSDAIRVGDLVVVGRAGSVTRDAIVIGVDNWTSDLGATVYCQPYAPEIYDAADGGLPPWQPATFGAGAVSPVVVGINAGPTAVYRAPDGTWRPRIIVSIAPPAGFGAAGITAVEAQYTRVDGDEPWQSVTSTPYGDVVIDGVDAGATYTVRLRWIGERPGPWTQPPYTVVVTATPGAPPDLDDFRIEVWPDGTRIFYGTSVVTPQDVLAGGGYEIRAQRGTSFTWESATPLVTGGLIQGWPWETNQLAAGTWTIGAKAVNATGIASQNARIITATLPDPRMGGALAVVDYAVEGWPAGVFGDCAVSGGILEALPLGSGGTWQAVENVSWASLGAGTWVTAFPRRSPISYQTPTLDIGADALLRPTVDVTADGLQSVQMRVRTAAQGSAFGADPWVAVGNATGRYLQIRVTAAGPTISDLRVVLAGEAVIDTIQDLDTGSVAAPWYQRLSAGRFRVGHRRGATAITTAQIVAIQSGGSGWTWRLATKTATIPGWQGAAAEFEVFRDGAATDAVVDIILGGFS